MFRLLACLAATAALTAPAQGGAYSTSKQLDDVATWLAMRPVQVRCLTPAEAQVDWTIALYGASAYVDVLGTGRPADFTVFGPGLCPLLLAVADGSWRGKHTIASIGWATLVLVHEAGHLRGHGWWLNEARTNCWAIRHVRYTALRLGASPDLAAAITSWAVFSYLRQPPGYRLAGCKLPQPG